MWKPPQDSLAYIIALGTVLGVLWKWWHKFVAFFKWLFTIRKRYIMKQRAINEMIAVYQQTKNQLDQIIQVLPQVDQNVKQIHESVEVLRSIKRIEMDDDPKPIIEFNNLGMCTSVNDSFLDLVNMDESDAMNHGWQNCVQQKDRIKVRRAIANAINENRNLDENFLIVCKGVEHAVTAKGKPIVANGIVKGLRCIFIVRK